MKRLLVAAVVVVLVGCGEPDLWEDKGFDSAEDCYEFYNYVRPRTGTGATTRRRRCPLCRPPTCGGR